MDEKKILFLVTVTSDNTHSDDYYVIAPDETSAGKCVLEAYDGWDYSNFTVVSNVKRIAAEGQYSKPMVLLFASKNDQPEIL